MCVCVCVCVRIYIYIYIYEGIPLDWVNELVLFFEHPDTDRHRHRHRHIRKRQTHKESLSENKHLIFFEKATDQKKNITRECVGSS